MTHRIKLTPAQISAIECRMIGDEQVDGLTVANGYLVFDDAAATADAVLEACNAEDGQAELYDDKYARRAARSLSVVRGKVLDIQHAALSPTPSAGA